MRPIKSVTLCTVALLAVVSLQAQTSLSLGRVLGQGSLISKSSAPNIVEGREMNSPQGVALDRSSSPPAIYVSDAGNHRVLAWRNAESFQNGAFADLIIGQADAFSTTANGPGLSGSNQSKGLYAPTGLLVDAQGNLYVMDSGNNRILRFPKPLANNNPFGADQVFGQANGFTTRSANLGGIGAGTLYLNTSAGPLRGSMAFDAAGNLWVTDSGNHRILRYPADAANPGRVVTTADRVIGQKDFTSNSSTSTINVFDKLRTPSGLALDSTGNLYVTDSMHRVLVFTSPQTNGETAQYFAGAKVTSAGSPVTPPTSSSLNTPEGVSINPVRGEVLVSDTLNNRVLWFPPLAQWTAGTSPTAYQWYGQSSETGYKGTVSATGLSAPVHVEATSTELYVVDSLNNRVVVFPQNSKTATRVLGQLGFDYKAPNLIVGKEVYVYDYLSTKTGTVLLAGGLTVDTSGAVPHLYIADTWNNRVLGYCDARKAKQGDTADVVVGQPDLLHSAANGDGGTTPNNQYLYFPTSVATDKSGNLYVADLGNGRVLRFAPPCAQAQTGQMTANLVLGQPDFATHDTDPSASTMSAPYGLAFGLSGNNLLVSDFSQNRVLRFSRAAGGDFSNAQSASFVYGQNDYFGSGAGNGPSQLNGPRHLAVDRGGRLIVTDFFNNRVLFFPDADTGQNKTATQVIDHTSASNLLARPIGVTADPNTGEIYVSSASETRVLKYPGYDQLAVSPYPTASFPSSTCFDIAHDQRGNIYVADASNRVGEYFTQTVPLNGAHFLLNHALTPGSLASAWINKVRPVPTSHAPALPLPDALGGLQVYVGGTLAPMLFAGEVSGTQVQVNFQVPNRAPSSGTVDIQVVDQATQEVLGAGFAGMQTSDPGIFTTNSQGTGQVSAVFQRGGVYYCNGPAAPSSAGCPGGTSPIKPGEVLELYLTGPGFQSDSNWPKDGQASPTAVPTSGSLPMVWIGTGIAHNFPAEVQYSGVAPNFAGLWQINVVVPNTYIDPDSSHTNPIILKYRDIFSQPKTSIVIEQQ